jgi:hypothetical protein
MNLDPFYSNPANAAMPYLQQVPGTITPYFQPYVDAGQGALQTLLQNYQQLLNNPGALISQVGSGYQQSPGYQYTQNSAMNAANAAAAAGGSLGTTQHQQEAAQQSADIANQDYQQYLNQALGLYGAGLQGEQGINKMGYQASSELAQDLASNLASEGSLAFQGAQGQNAANASMVGLASAGIGGLLGGVPGAQIGAGLGGYGATPGAMGGMGGMGGMGSKPPGGSQNSFLSSLLKLLGPQLFGEGSFFS